MAALLTSLLGCASLGPQPTGLVDGRLRPCPPAPHCVSSDEAAGDGFVAPLAIAGDADAAWRALRATVAALPRTQVMRDDAGYLAVTQRTAIMGYVDDVEFVLRGERGEIGMRSCSRLGYYDFGVNRERLEALRATLRAQGSVR